MTDSRSDWRIVQHGEVVATVSGPSAHTEIWHYAWQYAQDAPVEVEERVDGAWLRRHTAEVAR